MGYGTGSYKLEFDNYYNNNSTILYENNRLYTHNQFLTQIINLGLFGFLLWIFLLGYSVNLQKKVFDPLFLAYVFLMIFSFISDDILERQVGVTIFSSILTILLFYSKREKELLTK